MKTIAEHAVDVCDEFCRKNGFDDYILAWGDLDLLGEISSRSAPPATIAHPLDRCSRVLKALRGSKLFERVELTRPGGYRGGPGVWVGYRYTVSK